MNLDKVTRFLVGVSIFAGIGFFLATLINYINKNYFPGLSDYKLVIFVALIVMGFGVYMYYQSRKIIHDPLSFILRMMNILIPYAIVLSATFYTVEIVRPLLVDELNIDGRGQKVALALMLYFGFYYLYDYLLKLCLKPLQKLFPNVGFQSFKKRDRELQKIVDAAKNKKWSLVRILAEKRLSNEPDGAAYYFLGYLYLYGLGVEADIALAKQHLSSSSEFPSEYQLNAINLLADYLIDNGQFQEASHFLEIAVSMDDKELSMRLASLKFFHGLNDTLWEESVDLLHKLDVSKESFEDKDERNLISRVRYHLGLAHLEGKGTVKDVPHAVKYLESSGSLGLATAYAVIANGIIEGDIPTDVARGALGYFELAVRGGSFLYASNYYFELINSNQEYVDASGKSFTPDEFLKMCAESQEDWAMAFHAIQNFDRQDRVGLVEAYRWSRFVQLRDIPLPEHIETAIKTISDVGSEALSASEKFNANTWAKNHA